MVVCSLLISALCMAQGSAFISFSRRDVLAWKQTLGTSDCAAVYGALSPEVSSRDTLTHEQRSRVPAGE